MNVRKRGESCCVPFLDTLQTLSHLGGGSSSSSSVARCEVLGFVHVLWLRHLRDRVGRFAIVKNDHVRYEISLLPPQPLTQPVSTFENAQNGGTRK